MESDPGNPSEVREHHVHEETSDVWSELFRTVASLNDAVDLSLQASGADASTDKVGWRAWRLGWSLHCSRRLLASHRWTQFPIISPSRWCLLSRRNGLHLSRCRPCGRARTHSRYSHCNTTLVDHVAISTNVPTMRAILVKRSIGKIRGSEGPCVCTVTAQSLCTVEHSSDTSFNMSCTSCMSACMSGLCLQNHHATRPFKHRSITKVNALCTDFQWHLSLNSVFTDSLQVLTEHLKALQAASQTWQRTMTYASRG